MYRRGSTLVALACLFFVYNNYVSAKPGEKDSEKPPSPPRCPKNEVLEFIKEGSACEEPSCEKPNPPACTKAVCFCKKGTVRDWNNRCIPIEKCPKCEVNSHFSKCPDPCPATCAHTLPLPCKKACRPGCQCDDGFVRSNINDKCVPIKDCPKHAGCDKNQTWVPCDVNCGTARCAEDDKPQPVCDPPNPCPGGCHCKPGYRLNNEGKCILASECPPVKCTRQNEVWSSCPPENLEENCSDRENKPQEDCNPDKCNPRCICKKEYFRNDNGICIPECECPSQCKGSNEKYVECPAGQCVPKNCKDLGFPIPCPEIIPPCPGGCLCEPGYVRNSEGICIKKEDCPSCGGDENAVSGCGNNCGNSSSDRNETDVACALLCDINGCDCRKDYVFDQNTKKCVLPTNCNVADTVTATVSGSGSVTKYASGGGKAVATASGGGTATATVSDDSSATATASDGSTANAIAVLSSTATATASEGGTTNATACLGSTATATASNAASSATADAINLSTATATASGGGSVTAIARDGATVTRTVTEP